MQLNVKELFRVKSIEQILKDVSKHGDIHGDVHGAGPAKGSDESNAPHLRKTLGVWDLTFLGIAAIIGAGIFSTIGNAAANGGPAVVFLFILTAIACAFSALCYAEFASAIPIAGSAYTYAYASFGELFAWIIGWDLLCEYAIGNMAVAISWSEYFTNLMGNIGVKIPRCFTMDYMTASRSYEQVTGLLAQGKTIEQITQDFPVTVVNGYHAWLSAPVLGGIHLIGNLPALLIITIITAIVYWGISRIEDFEQRAGGD